MKHHNVTEMNDIRLAELPQDIQLDESAIQKSAREEAVSPRAGVPRRDPAAFLAPDYVRLRDGGPTGIRRETWQPKGAGRETITSRHLRRSWG
jgi:hypothetical protein